MSFPWTQFHIRRQRSDFHAAGNSQHSFHQQVNSPEDRYSHLRSSLEALGPLYSCFALYLSSRIDILPAEYCRELALTADLAPPMDSLEVQRILKHELNGALDQSFEDFDYVPQQSNLITQSHLATLRTGSLVRVSLVRPEYHALGNTQSLRTFIDCKMIQRLFPDLALEAALPDFLTALKRKADLSVAIDAIDSIVRHERFSYRPLGLRVYRELSTARLLTLSRIENKRLDQVLSNETYSRNDLARTLCHVWLDHALSAGLFPVDLTPGHFAILSDGQISFGPGCEWVMLPKATKENLSNYLLAAMVDDPDRSAIYLLREMEIPGPSEINVQSFRTSFRQSAYFAALEPILGTDSNSLAQLIFQHWKTALEHRCHPKPHLLSFFRGLFTVARIAREISATQDSLREGVDEFRTKKIFEQVRDFIDFGYLMQNADKFANAMITLPGTVDEALNHASHPVQPVSNGSSPNTSRESRSLMAVCLLLLALLISQWTFLSNYSTKIIIGLLMLAGLLALRSLAD